MKLKLRQLREKNKISQNKLANLLSISQPLYSKIEGGDGNFSDEEWQLIANFFNVEITDVREEDDNKLFTLNNYNQKGGYFSYTLHISDKLIEQYEKRIEEKDENSNFFKSHFVDSLKQNQVLHNKIISLIDKMIEKP